MCKTEIMSSGNDSEYYKQWDKLLYISSKVGG